MTDQLDLEGLADEAAKLEWTITKYHDVEGPDGRTVELNGFASVMAGGERQRWSRARTKLVVDVLAAFPGAIAALRASEAECERLKVENVNLRIAFDMADESREVFFRRAAALSEALERVKTVRVNKSVDNIWSALDRAKKIACEALASTRTPAGSDEARPDAGAVGGEGV